jgi:hypothetical protein
MNNVINSVTSKNVSGPSGAERERERERGVAGDPPPPPFARIY